jgi:outer membrane protein OmpA-like peptidoglycan-associated protein
MSDVLFDFNKSSLRQAAREKLAKISGIILSHPGLLLEVDGYTDSIGTDEYNMKLSEQRAGGVRSYLIGEGISPDTISARGFGKDNPVASNETAAGRQKNRRVEMVVSGDIIGTPIGGTPIGSPVKQAR